MNPSRFRPSAITIGLLVCVLSVYKLVTLWNQPVDAYWTPAHLALSLDATKDRLEVLVAGVPLAKALDEKRLTIATSGNILPLSNAEVNVRVNDYDHVRVVRIPAMLGLAAVAGGGFVLFAVGLCAPLIGAFRQRGLVDLHLSAS